MQAYKLKGTIDRSGHLIITEPIGMPPGEVEVIVLQSVSTVDNPTANATESQPKTSKKKFQSKLKAFQGLFENAPPVPPDFDPDQARWEALKEKHNL